MVSKKLGHKTGLGMASSKKLGRKTTLPWYMIYIAFVLKVCEEKIPCKPQNIGKGFAPKLYGEF
jgi:hypothetical protein